MKIPLSVPGREVARTESSLSSRRGCLNMLSGVYKNKCRPLISSTDYNLKVIASIFVFTFLFHHSFPVLWLDFSSVTRRWREPRGGPCPCVDASWYGLSVFGPFAAVPAPQRRPIWLRTPQHPQRVQVCEGATKRQQHRSEAFRQARAWAFPR